MCIMLTGSLYTFVGLFSKGVLGPAVAQAFTFFGACTKVLLIWLRGWVHPSHPEIFLLLWFIDYVYKTNRVHYLWCLVSDDMRRFGAYSFSVSSVGFLLFKNKNSTLFALSAYTSLCCRPAKRVTTCVTTKLPSDTNDMAHLQAIACSHIECKKILICILCVLLGFHMFLV